MTKVSVIITVFNRSHLLRKALISLSKQSFRPDELIISDDGSEENILDDIKDIIEEFSFKVKYVKHANKGFRLAKCRNNGVRVSSGNLLIFLDQDLLHTQNLLRTFVMSSKSKRFLTGIPIYLDEEMSFKLTEEKISKNNFSHLIDASKLTKIKRQYRKDMFSYYMHKLRFEDKPKVRGGVCAFNKKDFEKINGYDEKYIGWGNEDDDISRRLYKGGMHGFNPFLNDYAIHLYHEPFRVGKERLNLDYHVARNIEIKKGKFRCEYGLDNPYGENSFETIELN